MRRQWGLVELLLASLRGTARAGDILALGTATCAWKTAKFIIWMVLVWPLLGLGLALWLWHVGALAGMTWDGALFAGWATAGVVLNSLLFIRWARRRSDRYDGHGNRLPRGMSRELMRRQIARELDVRDATAVVGTDVIKDRRKGRR